MVPSWTLNTVLWGLSNRPARTWLWQDPKAVPLECLLQASFLARRVHCLSLILLSCFLLWARMLSGGWTRPRAKSRHEWYSRSGTMTSSPLMTFWVSAASGRHLATHWRLPPNPPCVCATLGYLAGGAVPFSAIGSSGSLVLRLSEVCDTE